jgi:hypothetical protein
MQNDSTTRRAFALDSRAVWVESQIDKYGMVVPKDNYPFGPGEYDITFSAERHISTPSLGGFRGPSDHFKHFHTKLSGKTPGGSSSSLVSNLTGSIYQQDSRLSTGPRPERSEYMTIFHNHDSRMALDPNKRFTDTPAAYDITSTPSEFVSQDGTTKVKTVPFGPDDVPFGERSKTKTFGPEYNIKWDSPQIVPRAKLGFCPQEKRIYIPSPADTKAAAAAKVAGIDPCPRTSKLNNARQDSPVRKNGNPPDSSKDFSTIAHTNSFKASLVPLPKLKKRTPPVLYFDRGSYSKSRHIDDLTPNYIKKEAKIDFFSGIVKIPRKHVSTACKGGSLADSYGTSVYEE